MSIEPLGIHHVTAIATDPQRNADFYHVTMGLRLVKRTVNFDAPEVYHLYYGDEAGNPGTLITFFPWVGTPQGRRGTGQATVTSFSVPERSLGWWKQRLERLGVEVAETTTRFEEDALSFPDPDGLLIELIAHADARRDAPWPSGPVPAEHQIRGLYGVTLCEEGYEATAGMLVDQLGFRLVDEATDRFRFDTGAGGPGARVDLVCQPEAPRGLVAAGTVHHVAWRAPDRDTEAGWRGQLVGSGIDVTPIIDRQYFESIYFREPGGVLLEIATDPPGFTKDEPLLELGRALKLPPWLEPRRDEIARNLPDLKVPDPETWAEQGPGAQG
jgi:glyoxalase family protein